MTIDALRLCQALGIDCKYAKAVTIRMDMDHPIVVEVEQYLVPHEIEGAVLKTISETFTLVKKE